VKGLRTHVIQFLFVPCGINSGDADGRLPVIGTRYCVEALGLPLKSTWRSWYHDNQVLYLSFLLWSNFNYFLFFYF